MPLVGSESFFDGFGFEQYRERFGWDESTIYDTRENENRPRRPILPFLERISDGEVPLKWERRTKRFVKNDDWLLLDHALERRS